MRILLFASILTLIGCSENPSSSGNKSQDGVRCACVATTELNVISSQAFPSKMKVTLNDRIMIDECAPTNYSGTTITRNEKSGTIEGKIIGRIRDALKVEIIDKGSDCTNDAVFYLNENTDKEITVISDTPALPPVDKAVIKL